MGNPFCPNCTEEGHATMLISRMMDVNIDVTQGFLKKAAKALIFKRNVLRKGRALFWFCRRCRRRWRKGGEIIKLK